MNAAPSSGEAEKQHFAENLNADTATFAGNKSDYKFNGHSEVIREINFMSKFAEKWGKNPGKVEFQVML